MQYVSYEILVVVFFSQGTELVRETKYIQSVLTDLTDSKQMLKVWGSLSVHVFMG